MKRLGITLVTMLVLVLALGVANAQPPADWVSPVETRYAEILGFEVGTPTDVVYEEASRRRSEGIRLRLANTESRRNADTGGVAD